LNTDEIIETIAALSIIFSALLAYVANKRKWKIADWI
jgi:hypothetical protein